MVSSRDASYPAQGGTGKRKLITFECKQCGRCCLAFGHGLKTCNEDIELWRASGREDILKYTLPERDGDGVIVSYDYWFSPKTGRWLQRCPWLRKLPDKNIYVCRIHDVKPQVCRKYKTTKIKHEKLKAALKEMSVPGGCRALE